ncbi:MAG TPA: bifunctional glutamate N-acetyltransferase/amino-acid acetyltransferase ArgJ [Candidatus Acidoferrales bacterium]|jgi:glutamate N-acetyltransferase/amino-acid N-acetyltransferase|nr:bifunctional glutamate N-acetyltransferase/amino-acid acetyltransferase ArgJ [Candidatus Acidoferrales bacterium]
MPIRLTNSLLPRGFTFAATHCGLKKTKLDLAILVSETPASAAAVFTTNRVKAAPVIASQLNLRKSKRRMRGVIVNSGNANCCTGSEGLGAAAATTLKVARELGRLDPSQILVCSTGVIGVPLRWQKIVNAVPQLVRARKSSAGAFELFARAIMTTDTHPKWASAKCRVSGKQVRIAGCTKGAGMIHPNMATMLAFIATDAAISPAMLARALRSTVATTFNAITVDGDTSTNDTVTLLANGASGALAITRENDDWKKFRAALESVCKSLALQIVADGEGAQRVIEVEVRGAPSDRAAKQIALTIANSPLVKTALAGADPNWGRILAAAGRAGVAFDFERADITLAGLKVCRRGRENPFDERIAHHKMLAKYVPIVVDLRSGRGHARVWTCDFTSEYIHINASYRT